MRTERFEFSGEQGQPLSGRLHLPAGPPRATVLFAHCFTCTKDSIAAVRLARAMAELGFAILRFDFTGLGESGGAFSGTSFSGSVGDLRAAAAALERAGHRADLLVGHSLGGAAILAAAGDLPEIRAIVTIAAPYDVDHVRHIVIGIERLESEGEAEVSIGGRPFRLRREFLEDLAAQDQERRIAALGRPLLILHSPEDEVVEVGNAGLIYAAARHPRSFVALDGADHLLTRKADAERVAALIAAWASSYFPAEEPVRTAGQSGVVTATETGRGVFQVRIEAGGVQFHADEPPEVGGLGSGPTPYDLLAAGLGACTAMTVRLYARRKDLPLGAVAVEVGHARTRDEERRDVFTRRLRLEGELSLAQRRRLLEIAERCPVHLTLEKGASIRTSEAGTAPEETAEPPGAHAEDRAQLAEDGDPAGHD